MTLGGPLPVWQHLNALPEVTNWRRNRINEIEGFESDLRSLRDELRRTASFSLWIKSCERTRFYWSRFHAVGMAGSLPQKLERSGYEFISIVTDILALQEDVVSNFPSVIGQDLCRSYGHSMILRRMLVETLLVSSTVEVRAAIWRELQLPSGDGYTLEDSCEDPTCDANNDECSQRTILCGAYWIIAHKLDSWRLELENEAGPFAHSIRNHHELVLGGLQLFGLILRTGERLGDSDAMVDAEKFKLRIREELVQILADLWAEINDARPIPEDDLLGPEDLAQSHPLEEKAKEMIIRLRAHVVPYANEAEKHFKEARSRISKRHWNSWVTVAFENRYEFELPKCSTMDNPAPWRRLICRVIQNLNDTSNREQLRQLYVILGDCPAIEADTRERASKQVILLGRLLELDFSGSLNLVRNQLLEAETTPPVGFFELQLIGHVLRTVRHATNRAQSEKRLYDLIQDLIETTPARWGKEATRNALLARLLAAYFVVVPEEQDSIARLWTLARICVDKAGDDLHFFQILARDTLRLIDRGDGSWGKIIILGRLVPRGAVRWPDKLKDLSPFWGIDSPVHAAI